MSDPIPTKFFNNDLAWLDLTVARSGLGRADVIRRSVRLLAAAVKANPNWNWVKETSQQLPALTEEEKAEIEPGTKISLPGMAQPMEGMPRGAGNPPAFDKANARAKAEADAARRRRPRRARS